MPIRETFKAWGHPNIRARHKTTLMVTKELDVTTRGDCIVAIKAMKGFNELGSEFRKSMQDCYAIIRLKIVSGGSTFEVVGRGDPRLTLNHPTDMIVRKSEYVCDRTLMVSADKAACDVDSTLLKNLQDEEQTVNIELIVESVTQKDTT